jgi:hypothetical protein
VAANLEAVLKKLDGCQDEEIRALVVLASLRANACQYVVRQLQFAHL